LQGEGHTKILKYILTNILSGGNLAEAAWRQRGRSGKLLLVDCCLLLPPPSPLPPVSLSPPYLSLNSKMKNTVVKIVSYQYIPIWNCLLFM
jgi:hypothetical protein